ncbi:MAG: hypothetical protein NTY63_00365 [Candidatus Bipolaricaulota bacterium]|nr:hypothetical protein [Candidatus Bipolaricaulota bacterium]
MGARRSWKSAVVLVGCVAVMLVIAACAGFWNTPVQFGKLIVGAVQVMGTTGTVLVSVADMPDGGLGAIQFGTVGNEAITFTNIDAASIKVEGKNGFVVLAQAFAGGTGALIAAGCDGVVGGEILKFTFTVTGAHPTLIVTKAKVKLVSETNAFITTWELSSTAYYAR